MLAILFREYEIVYFKLAECVYFFTVYSISLNLDTVDFKMHLCYCERKYIANSNSNMMSIVNFRDVKNGKICAE